MFKADIRDSTLVVMLIEVSLYVYWIAKTKTITETLNVIILIFKNGAARQDPNEVLGSAYCDYVMNILLNRNPSDYECVKASAGSQRKVNKLSKLVRISSFAKH